jgi:glycosyltransferase involved in cell wall biosynthesis
MKIDVVCGAGSQNGVTVSDIYGKNGRVGVGGSESALLTMCEAWARRGDEVTVYNNPTVKDDILEQRPVNAFNRSDNRDIVIFFRQPTSKVMQVTGKKIFWSCDQYTEGDFRHFSQFVDAVVAISPFHAEYLKTTYGIEDAKVVDLPVRIWDYEIDVEKVANRIIFTSVPMRGLAAVAQIFPAIKARIPDVSLVVTSDYRLWGNMSPQNQEYVQKFLGMDGVQFLGAVPRDRLVREQLQAQIHLYPFTGQTEELFCLSVAESQVAGVLPITSTDGALETTNMGVLIEGDSRDSRNNELFVDKVVEYLGRDDLGEIQKSISKDAKKRFDVKEIMKTWDEEVFA